MGSDSELRRLEKKIEKKEKEKSGEAPTKKEKQKEKEKPAYKPSDSMKAKRIVRVADTNLDSDQKLSRAIREVKGVSDMFANGISKVCSFSDKYVRDLNEEEIKQIEEMLTNPVKYGIPLWMINRRNDPQTGENRHLIVSNLDFTKIMDINELKKWKTYKGIRHGQGLPVRGQRTRSSFRVKGRTVGVQKKKEEPAKAGAPAKPAEKKK